MSFDVGEDYGLTAIAYVLEIKRNSTQITPEFLTPDGDARYSIWLNQELKNLWLRRWNYPLWF